MLQLTYGQCVGSKANVFVSFAYLMRFCDLVNVAEGYLRKQGPRAEESTFFWFDLLVNDQWAATEKPFEWWTDTNEESVGTRVWL